MVTPKNWRQRHEVNGSRFCPQCRTPRHEAAPYCTECGFDYATLGGSTASSKDAAQGVRKPWTAGERILLAVATVIALGLVAVAWVAVIQPAIGEALVATTETTTPTARDTARPGTPSERPISSDSPASTPRLPRVGEGRVIRLELSATGSFTEDVSADVPWADLQAFCQYLPVPSDPTTQFVSVVNFFSEGVPGATPGWVLFYRDDDGPGTRIDPTVVFRGSTGFDTVSYYNGMADVPVGTAELTSSLTGVRIDMELAPSVGPERVRVNANVECPPAP